jgi:synaptobrevin family protein YKT6
MKYKNAKDVDKIQQIKSDLDETKTIMMDSIDSLFQRGEQLEVLVDKAEELEKASELLQIKTKKLNSCCPLF